MTYMTPPSLLFPLLLLSIALVASVPALQVSAGDPGVSHSPWGLSTGNAHSCVRLCGSVFCYGSSASGALGTNDATDDIGDAPNEMPAITAVPFPGLPESQVDQISAGDGFSCALFGDGSVACWGDGADGRLGTGDTASVGGGTGDMESLQAIPFGAPSAQAVQVSAGTVHACALFANGGVRCWGNGSQGQLGIGSTASIGDAANEMEALQFIGFATPTIPAVQVCAGGSHTCVVFENGGVRCFGRGMNGRLGTDSTSNVGTSPSHMTQLGFIPFPDAAKQVAVHYMHTCVVFVNGGVRCFGRGEFGKLGSGNQNDIGTGAVLMSTLGYLPFGTTHPAVQVTNGVHHSCALFSNGRVRCWGYGPNGQLGLDTPVTIGDADGEIAALGFIPFEDTNILAVQVTAGSSVTCVMFDNSRVRCFGNGSNGRLGAGSSSSLGDSAGEMTSLPFIDIRALCSAPSEDDMGAPGSESGISAGGAHNCARLPCGEITCFGHSGFGRLGASHASIHIGDSPGEMSSLAPVAFQPGEQRVSRVSAGQEHTCALFTNGVVRCFGRGESGRLGTGSPGSIGEAPNGVATLPPVVFPVPTIQALQVSAGLAHTCVLFVNGGVRCFGAGAKGRLGTNANDDVGDGPGETDTLPFIGFSDPTVMATQVSAGGEHTCVLFSNGQISCFGGGSFGQLGTDSTADVGGSLGDMGSLGFIVFATPSIHARQISASRGSHTCALFSNGGVRCFGLGLHGRLGTDGTASMGGSTNDMSTLGFITFATTHPATQVATGMDHTCALFLNGGVRCFGSGSNGKLGTGAPGDIGGAGGDMASLGFITFAGGLGPATQITLGDQHTCVQFDNEARCFGSGTNGAIGSGATDALGDESGEMVALPPVIAATEHTCRASRINYISTSQSYSAVGEALHLNVTGTAFSTKGGTYKCTLNSDDTFHTVETVSVTVLSSTNFVCNFDAAGTTTIGTQGAALTIEELSPLSMAVPFVTARAKVTFVTLGPTTLFYDETDSFCAQNAGALGTCDFWHFGSLKSLVASDSTQHGCICQCCAPIARRQPQRCQWTGMRGIDEGAGGSSPRDRLTSYIKIDRPQVTTGSGQCGDGLVTRAQHACDALHVSPAVMEEQCDDGNNADGDGCSSNCRWE